MTKRVPVEWIDQSRLRLAIPGEIVGLYDDGKLMEPERYAVDEAAGVILLFAEPKGPIRAELKSDDAPPRAVKAEDQ